MSLLVVFAFLAGAGTALSPCVLPVLPALLSAGATGGRRRPLGIVTGLAITFTVTIVGLATVVDGVGLGDSTVRWLAIVALAAFGIAIAVPAVGDRLEAPLSRLARFGPAQPRARVLVGRRGRRRARLPLRAVRRPDPRRRRVGGRRVRATRSRSAWRSRSAPRPCCSCSRSAGARSPTASGAPAADRPSSARSAS